MEGDREKKSKRDMMFHIRSGCEGGVAGLFGCRSLPLHGVHVYCVPRFPRALLIVDNITVGNKQTIMSFPWLH